MQKQPPLTLREKVERIQNTMAFVAVFILPMIRYDIGPRLLNPGSLGLVAAGLVLIGGAWANRPPPFHSEHLVWFAFFVLAEGLRQRARQLRAFKKNAFDQHTHFIGFSLLRKLGPPAFLAKERRVERFCDGALILFIGYLLLPYSRALGLFLIFGGSSLIAYEGRLTRQHREERMDLRDGVLISEIQGQIIEEFKQPQLPSGKPIHPHVIATGMDPMLRDRVKNQQNKPKLPIRRK